MSYKELAIENQLCFALYNASRAMTKAYQPHLKKLGLTYPQYIVMLCLWQHGSSSVKALGECLSLDSGTLTPLLKRLEGAQFVVRKRSEADERVVMISLAPKGAELEQRALAMRQYMLCQKNEDISALGVLLSQLEQLTSRLK